jgi:hypothetical protein
VVEHSFRDEVLFELGDGMQLADCTRDGQHVFWLQAHDGGETASIVWDGVAGPQFDDFVPFDEIPFIFSPDKHHVAWIGKRGGTFVVVVDNSVRLEWDNMDTEVVPVVSKSGRIALIATHGTRRVILDGSPLTDWEAAGSLAFSADGEHFAFVAREGPRWRVVVDGVSAGPAFDQVGAGSLGSGSQTVVFSRDGTRFAYGAKRG